MKFGQFITDFTMAFFAFWVFYWSNKIQQVKITPDLAALEIRARDKKIKKYEKKQNAGILCAAFLFLAGLILKVIENGSSQVP